MEIEISIIYNVGFQTNIQENHHQEPFMYIYKDHKVAKGGGKTLGSILNLPITNVPQILFIRHKFMMCLN